MLIIVAISYGRQMSIDAYTKLQFYINICYIRRKVYQITEVSSKTHLKVVGQMRDAARSAKQNIREGYKKDSVGTFIHHIKISKGSLDELLGDLEDFFEDELITEEDFNNLNKLIQKTDFMMDRYIDALYKLDKEGKWKSRFKK